jgi:ribulose-phosphate 3-epimerase
MPANHIGLHLGVKSDPIEHRYSWDWLFRILAEEEVDYVQMGTFFELYQLPDDYFLMLRDRAGTFGIQISSVFTAHRELGGFLRSEPAWQEAAFKSYQRLIRVAALVGASSVGSNPGAVLRDQMNLKASGVKSYVAYMKKLMQYARECGVQVLAIEPMSCLAEPPTLPYEIRGIVEELEVYHQENPNSTAQVGYCFDVSHGYLDASREVRYTNLELLRSALPYTTEMHLKNTNKFLEDTFGFSAQERTRGIVDIERIRDFLVENADRLPVRDLIGYLEIPGPKLGRDYSDSRLEGMLRASIQYLRETFSWPRPQTKGVVKSESEAEPLPTFDVNPARLSSSPVTIAPSMMCADMGRLEEEILILERLGVAMLHWDIMDAHFVPNMPCGLEVLAQMRRRTKLPFDVHLMVENNEFFIHELTKIGVEQISVHYESAHHCHRVLSLIRESGAKAGLALNPSTLPHVLEYVADLLDFLLVMTVDPGFAAQKLTASSFAKIRDCRAWLNDRGLSVPIEVDGNVSFDNIPKMLAAGADVLVVGTSSLFNPAASREENMKTIQTGIGLGLRMRSEAQAACGPRLVRAQP